MRRIVGLVLVALVAPWALVAVSRLIAQALPATSSAATMAVTLVALALGLVLPVGLAPRRALVAAAALVAATALFRRPLVEFLERWPADPNVARALALAGSLGLLAFLAGLALRGLAGARVGIAFLAAAAGTAAAGPLVALVGRGALLGGAAIGLGFAAWAYRDAGNRASPSLVDATAWAAGLAGGLASAVFVNRLRDVGAPSPIAIGVAASALVALGTGALIGLGFGLSRPRRTIAVIVIVLGIAAAFHWKLLGLADAGSLRAATLRFAPRTGFAVALGAAFTFAPIAASWGIPAGALLTILGRPRSASTPALAALALGAAMGVVVEGAAPDRPLVGPCVARAKALPLALARRRPSAEVVLASSIDRERLTHSDARPELVVALPPADRSALTDEGFRAVQTSLAPAGIFCQWVRLGDLDVAAGEWAAVLRAFPFAHRGVWLAGFGDADPWLGLVGSSHPLTGEFDAARVATPLATYLVSGDKRLAFHEPHDVTGQTTVESSSERAATLDRATQDWGAFVAPARRETNAAANLRFLVEHRESPGALVVGSVNVDALRAASDALLRAEVARLRAERDVEARYVPAEAAARRDAQWEAYADAMRALPGDPEIERLVLDAGEALEPVERALRLQRLVDAAAVASGPLVRALEEARATERR